MEMIRESAGCSAKNVAVGAGIMLCNIGRSSLNALPWVLAFCLGLAVQILWTQGLVDWMSAGAEDYGFAPLLVFLLNVLCVMVLVGLILSANMTLDNPLGLLLMMTFSWVFVLVLFSGAALAIMLMMLVMGVIFAPPYAFASLIQWLLTPEYFAALGLDKILVGMVFYPLCFVLGIAFVGGKHLIIECCRLGQLHEQR